MRLQYRCFPVDFSKILGTSFLQNNSGQLLLCKVIFKLNNTYLDNTKEINTIFCYNVSFKTNLLPDLQPTLREKYPNREFFLVRIFLYSEWIRRFTQSKSPYSVRIHGNTDQKKLGIWTLFTQCKILDL